MDVAGNTPRHRLTLAELQGTRFAMDRATGRTVERRVLFARKVDANAKGGNGNGKGRGGGKGGKGGSSCFAFIANGARWRVTEPYVLDTTNQDGMSSAFVALTINNAFNTWDSQVSFDIFGSRDTSSAVDGADTQAPDGKNEVMFRPLAVQGAIAVTIVWGFFSGPPKQREIVEYDLIFDDPDFKWGDAKVESTPVMDLLNIAVHEIGHACGLADLNDSSCSEETMFGVAAIDETKKRTLNAGDKAGIKKLYE